MDECVVTLLCVRERTDSAYGFVIAIQLRGIFHEVTRLRFRSFSRAGSCRTFSRQCRRTPPPPSSPPSHAPLTRLAPSPGPFSCPARPQFALLESDPKRAQFSLSHCSSHATNPDWRVADNRRRLTNNSCWTIARRTNRSGSKLAGPQ
jgi:hypothetical protein